MSWGVLTQAEMTVTSLDSMAYGTMSYRLSITDPKATNSTELCISMS